LSADRIHPVILSGGSGTRLWPLSRTDLPKQLLALTGSRTLLQETASRVADRDRFVAPILVCNQDHRFLVAEQIRALGIHPAATVLEPVARNTAPAIAAAAHLVMDRDPEGVLLVLPSDHHIANLAGFLDALGPASAAARSGAFALFGIAPSGPSSGYGYIVRASEDHDGVHGVQRFVEKPVRADAEALIAAGTALWNSGIFMFRADRFLAELARLQPAIARAAEEAIRSGTRDLDFLRLGSTAFASAPAMSVDHAVMEHTNRAVVVPIDVGWSDLGAWSALWDIAEKDADGNALIGDVLVDGVTDCYVRGDRRLVALLGVSGLSVVDTDDALLVMSQDRAQDVRRIVDRLAAAGRPEAKSHKRSYRPWGYYETIDLGRRHQVKHIQVKQGGRLSLQMHHHRAEHWIVVSGTARVTRGDDVMLLHENESLYIPIGQRHRLENPGRVPLDLIEVQTGTYLGEDDIVRFEDTYGRT